VLGRADQVALVLAIGRVDHHDHLAAGDRGHRLLDRSELSKFRPHGIKCTHDSDYSILFFGMGTSEPRTVDFGLWYDFRNPPRSRRSTEAFYGGAMEQIATAEKLGFDAVWVSEHHFCEDGYTPSPLLMLAAVAARTERLRLGTALMIPALHDPLRLAEDAATLAALSGGRFDLGLGAGYRELEFEAFGRELRQRPSLLEESIAVLRRAWTGAPIEFAGRRFKPPAVAVTPVPSRPPRILIGASAPSAIERAARLGDGFLSPDNSAFGPYLEAFERVGRDPGEARIAAVQFVICDEDPERTWARVGAMAVAQLNAYIEWGAFGPPATTPRFGSPEDVLAAGAYRLWDGAAARAELGDLLAEWPQVEAVHWPALLPGEDVESGSARIEYQATEVLAPLRERLGLVAAPAGWAGGAA